MDLGAYIQIADLGKIAEANGIEVPRLRGYRLMSEEAPISREEIERATYDYEMHLCDWACCSIPAFCAESDTTEFSPRTDRIRKKYCMTRTLTKQRADGSMYCYEEMFGFRWELLHGKRRKALKFAIKKGRKEVKRSLETFNKYAGREDVLYIHARIGGRNWLHYGGAEIEKQPWFLEKVDDYFDSTYCDIYAKIQNVLD